MELDVIQYDENMRVSGLPKEYHWHRLHKGRIVSVKVVDHFASFMNEIAMFLGSFSVFVYFIEIVFRAEDHAKVWNIRGDDILQRPNDYLGTMRVETEPRYEHEYPVSHKGNEG